MTADQVPETNPYLISHITLRRAVGLLGVTLPFILPIGIAACGTCENPILPAISDYYYSAMSTYFVGTWCAVSLFLFAYKGYENDKRDMIAARLACLFGLCVVFFPTMNEDPSSPCSIMKGAGNEFFSTLHDVFAALFFITLAYMSYFLFTITSDNPTKQKLLRNKVYRTCAVVMMLCLVLILLVWKINPLGDLVEDYSPIFVLETIALMAFGTSWLVKGEAILWDKPV